MTFIGEELPQPMFSGKRKEDGITDVREISEVLLIGAKLKRPTSDIVIRTHLKVDWNGHRMTVGGECCVQRVVQTRREAQHSRQRRVHCTILYKHRQHLEN